MIRYDTYWIQYAGPGSPRKWHLLDKSRRTGYDGGKRRPGRPRSEHSQQAILRSTLKLLQKTGFADLSIEAIAADAGVGKATVYRWWPNKGALVVDAFASVTTDDLHFPDRGSVYKDVSLQMNQWLGVLRSPRGRIVAAVIAGGQSDAELIEAFRSSLPSTAPAGGLPDTAAWNRARRASPRSGPRSGARHPLRRNLHALPHSPRRP